MNNLNNALTKMDFDFLSTGQHSMSSEAMKAALQDEHFFFLDVRTEQELQYLNFPFATHIPMHELPARIAELPKDKCIVPFCAAIFRASVAYAYLLANGFTDVKCLTASTEEIASVLKPGLIAKILA